jgi:hypothetical protein
LRKSIRSFERGGTFGSDEPPGSHLFSLHRPDLPVPPTISTFPSLLPTLPRHPTSLPQMPRPPLFPQGSPYIPAYPPTLPKQKKQIIPVIHQYFFYYSKPHIKIRWFQKPLIFLLSFIVR